MSSPWWSSKNTVESAFSPQILGRWLKEAEDNDGHAFRGNGTLTPEQAEIRSLKGQVKRLEMEREILKKATVCVL
jgi:transposase